MPAGGRNRTEVTTRFNRPADWGFIFIRTTDRFLEDRRVRRHTLDAIVIGQSLQVDLGDKIVGEEVEPDCLAMLFE